MEELQVKEYVRTKDGKIDKILDYSFGCNIWHCKNGMCIDECNCIGVHLKDIVKHSKNKIDLIEKGDYANGEYVYELGNAENGDKWVCTLNGHLYYEKDIKTIWTKELLKSIEYNVN